MKEEINSIKNLLYSGQKINVDLAISIMDSLGLTWDSKGFEEEKELIDLYGNSVFYKTYLDLSYGNPLESLPESMGRLQKLESLDLGDNQLSSLPAAIGQLQQLKTLWLEGNPLSNTAKEELRKQLPNTIIAF